MRRKTHPLRNTFPHKSYAVSPSECDRQAPVPGSNYISITSGHLIRYQITTNRCINPGNSCRCIHLSKDPFLPRIREFFSPLKISGYFREAPPTLISISNRIFPTLEFAEINIGIKREVNGKAGIKWGRHSCLPIGPGSDRWHSRGQDYPRHLEGLGRC